MKLLLDTCTCLWMVTKTDELSAPARAACLDADNERFISAASVWEIAIKYSKGRLPLDQPPEQFLVKFLEQTVTSVLAIDEISALHAARLPRLHDDPFDRMLVAQSILNGMAIVTSDSGITQYGAHTLW